MRLSLLSGLFKTRSQDVCRAAFIEPLEQRSMLSGTVGTSDIPHLTKVGTGTLTLANNQTLALKGSVISLKASLDSNNSGDAVTLRATVAATKSSAIPTGTVTFKIGKTLLGTVSLKSGVAKLATTTLPVGSYVITANYNGSTAFGSATTSRSHTVTSNQVATSIKLGLSKEASTFGEPVVLAGRVANVTGGGIPTGRVAFYLNGSILGSSKLNSIGVARLTVPNMYTATHTLKAVYLGSTESLGHRSGERTLTVNPPTLTTQTSGLKTSTVVAGTGTGATAGQLLTVNYTGFFTSGTIFDSSLKEGRTPFEFNVGVTPQQVIEGWNSGMLGAKVGETRVLVVPPDLGYGATDYNGIPGGSTLIFIVSVVSIA